MSIRNADLQPTRHKIYDFFMLYTTPNHTLQDTIPLQNIATLTPHPLRAHKARIILEFRSTHGMGVLFNIRTFWKEPFSWELPFLNSSCFTLPFLSYRLLPFQPCALRLLDRRGFQWKEEKLTIPIISLQLNL